MADAKKAVDFEFPVCFLEALSLCFSYQIFSGLKKGSRLIIYDFASRFVSHEEKVIIFIDCAG